jgi:hypothetical protein
LKSTGTGTGKFLLSQSPNQSRARQNDRESSVAEPAEHPLFAGAKVFFGPALIKRFKNSKYFILKFEVDFKNHNFVATGIYFKEPLDDHLCL